MNSQDFKSILIEEMINTKNVQIYYRNGEMIEGFAQRVYNNMSSINVCKRNTPRGESSDHDVRFDEIVKLIIKSNGKEDKVYQR